MEKTMKALETMLRLERGLQDCENRVAYLQENWPEYNAAMKVVAGGYNGWINYATEIPTVLCLNVGSECCHSGQLPIRVHGHYIETCKEIPADFPFKPEW